MSLTIYGFARSRAFRTLWMAHELDLDFECVAGMGSDGPSAALLAANPMGQVPTIVDDGFALCESMAINIYLAKKHGKLAPASLEDEAQTLRWCFWAATAVEKKLLEVLLNALGLMGREKDEQAVKAGVEALQRHFKVLNDALAEGDYLVGGAFSVADLNVAAVFGWGKMAGLAFAEHPSLGAWLERCLGREAAVKARS